MSRRLRPISTVADALATLERGFIVDEVENSLPKSVADSLARRADDWVANFGFGRMKESKGTSVLMHLRYEGGREIRWFE